MVWPIGLQDGERVLLVRVDLAASRRPTTALLRAVQVPALRAKPRLRHSSFLKRRAAIAALSRRIFPRLLCRRFLCSSSVASCELTFRRSDGRRPISLTCRRDDLLLLLLCAYYFGRQLGLSALHLTLIEWKWDFNLKFQIFLIQIHTQNVLTNLLILNIKIKI